MFRQGNGRPIRQDSVVGFISMYTPLEDVPGKDSVSTGKSELDSAFGTNSTTKPNFPPFYPLSVFLSFAEKVIDHGRQGGWNVRH